MRNECSRCHNLISSGELVIQIGAQLVYHRNCFACVLCGHRFEPGQHYALSNANPYCPLDFKRLFGDAKSRHSEMPLETRRAVCFADEDENEKDQKIEIFQFSDDGNTSSELFQEEKPPGNSRHGILISADGVHHSMLNYPADGRYNNYK